MKLNYQQKFLSTLLFALIFSINMRAQEIVVKSNLLSDAVFNVNGGVELGLAPKWTLDLRADYNAWDFSGNAIYKHLAVQPEVRYWFCGRFVGHFLGVHVHGGKYNIGNIDNSISFLGTDFSKLSDRRYQGWFAGLGVAYGYSWVLGRHWNLEAEFGFGYSYTRYDEFPCAECGEKLKDDEPHHYVGPTKAAINLIYAF